MQKTAASSRNLFLLALLPAAALASGVTPVEKVMDLLGTMIAKGKAAAHEEDTKFASFAQWCDDQTGHKTEEIGESKEKIEMLEAEIAKAAAHIEDLSERIAELEDDVARWEKDQGSAAAIRQREQFDFRSTLADFGETLMAVESAIAVLKKRSGDVAQSLLQLRRMRLIPDHARSALDAFLHARSAMDAYLKMQHSQQPAEVADMTEEQMEATLLQGSQPNVEATDSQMKADGLNYAAPEANAYEFQSGGIVEMLEGLKDKFDKQKRDLEEEELNAKHGFDAIMQQLTSSLDNAKYEIEKKTAEKAETEEKKAAAEGDLAQTQADLAEDVKYLDEMTALCAQKKKDYESRSKLRTEELETLEKAIEIIGGDKVSGAADRHLPSLVQRVSLAQLRSRDYSPQQKQVSAFLADRAKMFGSRTLAMVAQRVEEDPFKKVKKMIKDLVYKLMEEAAAEMEHKGFCDTELVTNQQTREKKAAEVAELQQQIENLVGHIADLTQEIADLHAAIEELDQAMAKATADREGSHAKNTQTIEEAKQGQEAVESAIALLKDFYAKASEATALAQQRGPADDAPSTFEAPYKGQQGSAGGVVQYLEVILTDFARLQSETETQEAMEVEEYEKFMHESKMDKALKENEIKHKEEKKTSLESDLQTAKEELKAAQEALADAQAYYEKLKPKCVDSGISYEERVKQREEEIQSLKEALAMLEGLDLPSVGGPAMKHNSYEEEEYESKSSSSVKITVEGSVSSSSSSTVTVR